MAIGSTLITNLRAGSPAFAVTALFAAVAWLITHTVDRVSKAPTVEYRIQSKSHICSDNQPCWLVTLRIANLSDSSFSGVQLELNLPDDNGAFLDIPAPSTHAIPPAWAPKLGTPTNSSVPIVLDQFHPGSQVQVTAYVSSRSDSVLLLRGSDKPMKLVRSSPETYFAKHETTFLTIATVILGGIALAVVSGSFFVPVSVSVVTAGVIAVYFL